MKYGRGPPIAGTHVAEVRDWHFDAMTTVAAPGFGGLPVAASGTAYNVIVIDGWIAFNFKETLLDTGGASGFPRLATRMLRDDCLKLHHLERYRRRLSVEGHMLRCHAVVGRKRRNIDDACLRDPN